MKKKLLSLVMVLTMLLTLSACSPNMKAYISKTSEVAKWKGVESEAKGNVKISAKEMNVEETTGKEVIKTVDFNLPLTAKVKQAGEKIEMDLVYDLAEFKKMMEKEEAGNMGMTIPEKLDFKIFIDGEDIIINKSVFLQLMGDEAPADLKNIKEDYIRIKNDPSTIANNPALNQKSMKYLNSAEFEADILKVFETALKDYKANTDIKVDGNTFTYEATSEELTDDTVNAITSMVKNWDVTKTALLPILNKMGMEYTEAQLNEEISVADFNEAELKNSAKEVKDALKGSNLKYKVEFGKDTVKEDAAVNLVINSKENGADVKMNITSEGITKKNENIAVNIPKAKEMTSQELMSIFMPGMDEPYIQIRLNGEEIFFEDQQAVIRNDRTLVPFRAMLEKLGAEVKWDQAGRTVTAKMNDKEIVLVIDNNIAKIDGKEIKMDVAPQIIGDRTMVPLRFVSENFGYKVKFDNEVPMFYLIDVYNMTDAELEKKLEEIEKEFEKQIEEGKNGDAIPYSEKEDKEAAKSTAIIGGADEKTDIKTK